MIMSSFKWSVLAGLTVCVAAGCAHNPPAELVDARAAYKQASASVAMQETPAELHTAHNALQTAEQSFKKDGASEHTRDLSYIALRKAQLAQVEGQLRSDKNRVKAIEANQEAAQGRELSQLRGQYQQQSQELAQSEAARKQSEQRAEQATAELANVANVRHDQRGTVITLSGEVLFASGKAELLPQAQSKLDEVAKALTQQDPDSRIVVEGHTDSQGKQAMNLDLSTRRAEAVRNYLLQRGVAPDRIRAEGLGMANPIADNKTAEGRADNRRVEIVVQPNRNPG